jgi:hypothetical protein
MVQVGCSWNSNLFSVHVHCISTKMTAHSILKFDKYNILQTPLQINKIFLLIILQKSIEYIASNMDDADMSLPVSNEFTSLER